MKVLNWTKISFNYIQKTFDWYNSLFLVFKPAFARVACFKVFTSFVPFCVDASPNPDRVGKFTPVSCLSPENCGFGKNAFLFDDLCV